MPSIRTLFTLILLLMSGLAQAQEAGDTVTLRGLINQNTYTAGGTIYSSAQIQGDLVASGGTIFMNGKVSDDVLLMGGTVNVTAAVGDDLRAMGGNVFVNSQVEGDAAIGGGQLKLGQLASIKGDALLAGGTVIVAGDIHKDLRAAGGRVVISGHIHGNVELQSDDIEIQKGARIDGNLTYHGDNQAHIDPAAKILGSVKYQPYGWERKQGPGNGFIMATLGVAAIVFYLLFPGFCVAGLAAMKTEFWKNLGLGLLMLLVVPFIAGFFMVIVFGMWLGLALLALYLVALLVASILGMTLVGEVLARLVRWPLSSRGRRIVTIIVAFVLVTLLQWVPILGGLLSFVILLLGLGATTTVLFRRYFASPSADCI